MLTAIVLRQYPHYELDYRMICMQPACPTVARTV